jgi:hypothetical protein
MSTGVGAETIGNAAKAGLAGDESFIKGLTGEIQPADVLQNAKDNLSVMRQNRSAAYKSGMTDISADKTALSFDDIDNALAKANSENRFGVKVKDDVAQNTLNDLKAEVNDWKAMGEAYHTPEGLDALKQRVGAIVDRIPYEEKNSARIGSNVYNSIKSTIADQAPTYSKVMGDYGDASEAIREIERSLSLGNKASADTAMRKLYSLTRNNVNTNYGNRLTLAQQLEQEGGKPFINALSGMAMSSPTARGLAGTAELGTMLAGMANPTYLAALPLQTPALVGRGLYYGGKAAKAANEFGITPGKANALSNLLNVTQKTKNQEEE